MLRPSDAATTTDRGWILLVEDNPGDARLTQLLLEESGHAARLRWVTTAGEAARLLASHPGCRAVLLDLDRQYPGIRFRVIDEQDRTRAHMRFFVNGRAVFDLATPLSDADELCLVQALSGG